MAYGHCIVAPEGRIKFENGWIVLVGGFADGRLIRDGHQSFLDLPKPKVHDQDISVQRYKRINVRIDPEPEGAHQGHMQFMVAADMAFDEVLHRLGEAYVRFAHQQGRQEMPKEYFLET